MSRTVEDLEHALAAAERKAAELQAWADASDADAEQLRARVAELETAKPAPTKEDGRVAELQAWVDSSEKEAEQLRARIAELESAKPAPAKEDGRVAELQAWVDSAEEEAEQLRARITELENAKPPPAKEDARVAELQAWVDSAEEDAELLRKRITELETAAPAVAKQDARVAELQAWVDAGEKEADELRARAVAAEKEAEVMRNRLELLGGSVGEGTHLATENRDLVARVSELEAVNHSLRQLNQELTDQVAVASKRDLERIHAQLEQARAAGAHEKVKELEHALEEANEAVATLEVQHEAAVEQVKRYVASDSAQHELQVRELEDGHRQVLVGLERQVASLEAQLAEKSDESSVLQVRVRAHEGEERRLVQEVATQRERACTAEVSLGGLRTQFEQLQTEKTNLEARATDTEHKLDEAKRWLAQGELDTADLEKQLEAVKTERAVLAANAHAPVEAVAVAAPASGPSGLHPPPPPADASNEDDLEGFSVQRMHRLEALLAAEQLRTAALQRFITTAEASLGRLRDELTVAQGKLADMTKRLGLSDAEGGEALDRLEAARRELHALFGELAHVRAADAAPAPQDGEELSPEDVLEAPMNALEQLATQQATAAKEATEALAGEQRAREQLMNDLTWLKGELEKLSNVREDLKQRLAAMVQRELKRKQVVAALLGKLRNTEVAAAARAGTLRRLQAAMELAQRNAVKVQTIYFQKQIGSLQRQLENVTGQRSFSARIGRR